MVITEPQFNRGLTVNGMVNLSIDINHGCDQVTLHLTR